MTPIVWPPDGMGTPRYEAVWRPDLLDAQLGAIAVHVFVDQQRLPAADDLRSKPCAKGPRLRVFAIGVRELEHHGGAIEQRDIRDGRVKQVAHLVADQLDQPVFIQLRGQRLGNAVDRHQLRGALADFVLALD